MNSLPAIDLSEFTPSSLTALENCSEASVYTPGYIQPYGVLFKLQEPHLKILQVSENVEQFFGISVAALLGQPLQCLFSGEQVKLITDILLQDNLEPCNPFELEAQAHTFRSSLHRTADALILELEPSTPEESTHSIQFYHRLQAAVLSLRNTVSLTALAQTLAREIKAITGFDRVMVYRFAADEHGEVIAEAKESNLDSYLGLHYPATDIPAPARKLFLSNWVRQIPNVNDPAVRLVSTDPSADEQPLDLSDCVLRGVSPYHVEYLQNMGVAGSLTISVIDDNRLWGLIACHHYRPRLVDYETRKLCELLGQLASLQLVRQQEKALSRYRVLVKTIQDNLQQTFLRDPSFIQQTLIQNAKQLLDLVHAEGAAIVLDQQISLLGRTPSLTDVQAILTSLPELRQQEIYLTDRLAQVYPAAKAFQETASGILAIAIVLQQKSYHILWFRPEQIQTVNWAGDPRSAVVVDAAGAQRLTPRHSFALWQETVRETALPWQPPEIEAARMMRNTLMLAVLEFSQIALEQATTRAEIANRAKSQFLTNMSHELRTPLNAILGFTQVMSYDSDTPTEFQEYLNIINHSGEHLLELINDVLEMSRIEAGQLVLAESRFSLPHLLRSQQDLFALKAAQKGLTLSFETAPDVPDYLCGDEPKLRQILINLISNAIKFTTQGSITVQVKITPTGPSNRFPSPGRQLPLSFIVKDTGCGIDRGDWDAVFEAFIQTEQGRHAQGTGLGLSISRRFARLMGGNITVQSTVDQGSTFTCTVRLHQAATTNQIEPESAPRVIGLEPGQPICRILVVEDILENQQLLQILLEPIGFEVHIAKDGVDAIAQWQQWQPNVILMDIQMPIMDGYEATRQIRAQERGRDGRVKIIAFTAYAFHADRTASLEAGCDDCLSKPFNQTDLFEILARHLGVQYCYAAQPPIAPVRQSLQRQDLNPMPLAWIDRVHEAALDLNDSKIRNLMALIPSKEQKLIEAMTFLVDNFQLEAIATLTEAQGDD